MASVRRSPSVRSALSRSTRPTRALAILRAASVAAQTPKSTLLSLTTVTAQWALCTRRATPAHTPSTYSSADSLYPRDSSSSRYVPRRFLTSLNWDSNNLTYLERIWKRMLRCFRHVFFPNSPQNKSNSYYLIMILRVVDNVFHSVWTCLVFLLSADDSIERRVLSLVILYCWLGPLLFDPCYAWATVVRARFLAAAFSDGSYLAHVNGAYLRHVKFCIVRGPPLFIVSPISQRGPLPRLVQSPRRPTPASPMLV